MSTSFVRQPRLTRIEQAVRRAYAITNPGRGDMVTTRNLIHNTKTLPLGFPASKVMNSRN